MTAHPGFTAEQLAFLQRNRPAPLRPTPVRVLRVGLAVLYAYATFAPNVGDTVRNLATLALLFFMADVVARIVAFMVCFLMAGQCVEDLRTARWRFDIAHGRTAHRSMAGLCRFFGPLTANGRRSILWYRPHSATATALGGSGAISVAVGYFIGLAGVLVLEVLVWFKLWDYAAGLTPENLAALEPPEES